ncbi:MAG: conjugal transfer protein TraR [Desulfuromonas sp.]|nr:MAG: conjugal transfer protein TraR [Desulfuromonas sp.]
MDDADRAKAIADQKDQDALADHLSKTANSKPGRTHCADCGDEIPQRRREAIPNVQRCIDCQQLLEHWGPL